MTHKAKRTKQRDSNPSLSTAKQVEYLKKQGVTFNLCTEEQAAEFLRDANSLLRTASYCELFPTKPLGPHTGEYACLDFEHLRVLSSLDRQLRECLLTVMLDIEHFARTQVLDECGKRGEDGCQIVRDYAAHLKSIDRCHIEGSLKARGAEGDKHDLYAGDLIAKYIGKGEHLDRMPVWVFLETIEFRVFCDFYLFCAQRWKSGHMAQQHCALKNLRGLRNACAHNACLLNGVCTASAEGDAEIHQLLVDSLSARGMKINSSRRSKLSNPRVAQMATVLYADSLFCARPPATERHAHALAELHSHWESVKSLFEKNLALMSFFDFFFKLVDAWVPLNPQCACIQDRCACRSTDGCQLRLSFSGIDVTLQISQTCPSGTV